MSSEFPGSPRVMKGRLVAYRLPSTSPIVIAHHAAPVSASQAPRPMSQMQGRIGPVDDPLEREADRIADAVVADRFPGKASDITSYSGQGPVHIPPSVHRVVTAPGEPLGRTQRDYFEPRFGRDLSGVFIHRDAAAGQSASALAAEAYTFKNHIVFGAGQFAPGTMAGNRLIAHELGHTMQQQNSAMPAIQRKPRRDAAEEDKDRPGIVSVTAYQRAKTGDAVLSDGTSATVDLIENKLAPGDYVTSPVGRVRGRTAQGMPGKFVYRYPVDPFTQELLDGLQPHIEIHIRLNPTAEIRQLPAEIRNFVTSDRAREASPDEYKDAAYAGQILEQAGVTPDELILVQESLRRDRESGAASTEFAGTQSDWALNYVEKLKNKKLDQANNWAALVEMAKILGDAPIHLLHRGGVGRILDPGGNEKLEMSHHINLLKFNKIVPTSRQELTSTGARLLSEFQALIRHFEDALVADLTNLAVTALDSAEASILRMDRQYVGMWQAKKWSPHYFWREVKKIKSNEKVIAAAAERDKVKGALDREQQKDALRYARNPIGALFEPVVSSTSYSQRTDERDKEKERQDQLFNQAVADQSNLKVTQGFSAQDILSATGPDEAVSKLIDFLFDGRQKITRARDRIKDRKVIFAADKIIDMEKERLKGALGSQSSEISRVIDDLASYRKSQTSLWDDILKVVEFVAMFVPGPIGWGLRVGVAAVNFDKKMTDIGTRSDLYGTNLSAKSVGSGEVGSALFDAALEVVPDFPPAKAGKSLTLGLERTAQHSADDAASIASRTASSAEHGKPQGLAGDAAGGSKIPDPPPGTRQTENAPPARPDYGVPTYGNLPGRVPTGGQRVQIIEKDGKYFELDYETGALTPASGEYAFARMPDGTLWASRYGHAEASMGGRVGYAGQMKVEDGALKSWSRESGTYKPAGGNFAEQAGFPITPDPLPAHAGKKVQLPVVQQRTRPREPAGNLETPGPASSVDPPVPAGSVDPPASDWTDFLPEAKRRTEKARREHGDSLIMMATPGGPASADRLLINQLAARGRITQNEMRDFIEALLREKPILGELANARRLTGAEQRAAMEDILHRAFREDRLVHEVVPDHFVRNATNDPENFASMRSAPGGRTLQIEESAFNSNSRFAEDVSHELAYFYGNVGGGFPHTDAFNGLDYLELTLLNGGVFPF